jgi:hypothetical protein
MGERCASRHLRFWANRLAHALVNVPGSTERAGPKVTAWTFGHLFEGVPVAARKKFGTIRALRLFNQLCMHQEGFVMANRVLWIKSLAVVAVAAGLVACGGGSRSAAPFYSSNSTVNATVAAYSGITGTYTFPAGVTGFGTTTTTDVAFGGTPAAPTFTIGSGGLSASGVLSFGSCIFTVTASSYPTGHPLALGQVVTINPCSITLQTSGQSYSTGAANIPVNLTLGTVNSNARTATFTVSPTGTIPVGTVTVTPATGSTGSVS